MGVAAEADDGLTPVPVPIGIAAPALGDEPGRKQERRREQQLKAALRTVVYLMLFRVGLATFLLAAMVAVALTEDSPEKLAGPFGRFVFSLLALTYMASLAFAVGLKWVKNPVRFAYVQMAVDLVVISTLVHGTGGAHSGFNFLYLIDVVAIALLPTRRGTAFVAGASAVCMLAVSLGGYLEVIPEVPGQMVFPWDLTKRELLFRMVLNLAGIVSVGALGFTLSSQSQQTGQRLELHEQYADDLASLHENTIRCLSSGLVTVRPAGAITSINDAACEILGLTPERALGQPLSTMIPGVASLLAEAGPGAQVRRREVSALRPDGTLRRLGISAAPLTDHKDQVIGRVIHFQDLTDLRRMEMAVQRSERLASIGRLAAGIAHEIRNPLASISGSVEVLRTLPYSDDDTKKLIDITIREADRLNGLITSLLDYARPPAGEQENLDLGQLVEEVVQTFRHGQKNEAILIATDIDADVRVQGAPGSLRQILWNLMRNACEAMPDGGQILVSVAEEEMTAGDREVVMSVSDTGVGIAAEDQERIFEPFFTKGKSSGTGLGLATVARIAEDHQGTVDVESVPGKGTTFFVRLPLAKFPVKG
jgi:two-component system sensor histidine kinase PilS (NtrC family)